jgi:low temperature requirement protein LtrA
MKFSLVDDVEAISRRWSIKLAKIGTAVSAGLAALQAGGLVSFVPSWAMQVLTGIVFAGVVLCAYVKQEPLAQADDATDKAA